MTMPGQSDTRYLTWVGMETDLIFNKGIDLPGFASFPLLNQPDTRRMMQRYVDDQIALAARHGLGTVLEAATWMANRDRAVPLGYDAASLPAINRDAVDLLAKQRDEIAAQNVVISANVGPRSDAYAPRELMSPDEAETYHTSQIQSFVGTAVDVISAYTFAHSGEAIGVVRAASKAQLPSVVAFTVETDGRLPTGQTLDEAIAQTDEATQSAASYFMVNCAHPEHFSTALTGNPRIQGVVVNASRCSHAELDEAEALDDGDPAELGAQIATLVEKHPAIRVIGGCCGTDFRHLEEMASRIGDLP